MKFWNVDKTSNNEAVLNIEGTIAQETWIGDEITPKQFCDDLKSLGDIKQLRVMMNSPGGDPIAGLRIYNELKSHPAKIVMESKGCIASTATIIAMAADVLLLPAASLWKSHNVKAGLLGYYTKEELNHFAEEIEGVENAIVEAYLSKTNMTKEELTTLMDQDKWLTGREAVNMGFGDVILYDKLEASLNNNILLLNSVDMDIKLLNIPDSIINDITSFNNIETSDLNQNRKENDEVEIKNVEELRAQYPSLVEEVTNEAINSERQRLKAIDDIGESVPVALLNKAKYDEPISAEKLSMQVLMQNKVAGTNFLNQLQNDVNNNGSDELENESNDLDNKDKAEKVVNGLANAFKKIIK